MKEGLIGFNNGNSSYSKNFNKENSEFNNKLISVRVLDIILDDTHPKFKEYGEWNGVGTIEFEEINLNKIFPSDNLIATPLNSYGKNYPLVNEIVLLYLAPSKNANKQYKSQTYYYSNSLNLWNHPHHNIFPDVVRYEVNKDGNRKSYLNIEEGSIIKEEGKETQVLFNSPKIGGTFKENANIRPLLSYAGDRIYEGRFGNSIRFGSTSKSKSKDYKNNWSGTGDMGDPILILRNGQDPEIKEDGWIPTIEDINKDLSSIYFTSYQSIPLNLNKENYRAFKNPPTQINSYSNPQIIANSGRIVLNSWEDFILLISNKGIALSANEDIGFSTKKSINMDSTDIRLGSKKAKESVILGDTFIIQFEQLLIGIKNLSTTLEKLQDWPGGAPTPNPLIPPLASSLKEVINNILNLIKDDKKPLLSKKVRTE